MGEVIICSKITSPSNLISLLIAICKSPPITKTSRFVLISLFGSETSLFLVFQACKALIKSICSLGCKPQLKTQLIC